MADTQNNSQARKIKEKAGWLLHQQMVILVKLVAGYNAN